MFVIGCIRKAGKGDHKHTWWTALYTCIYKCRYLKIGDNLFILILLLLASPLYTSIKVKMKNANKFSVQYYTFFISKDLLANFFRYKENSTSNIRIKM